MALRLSPMRLQDITLSQVTYATFAFILLVVAWQAFTDPPLPQEKPKEPPKSCIGEPIIVEYAFGGDFMEPWACQIQCEDKIQRYILYSNGQATQCEEVPGCLDWGEDHGVTCTPPMETPIGS